MEENRNLLDQMIADNAPALDILVQSQLLDLYIVVEQKKLNKKRPLDKVS